MDRKVQQAKLDLQEKMELLGETVLQAKRVIIKKKFEFMIT
jgi:hypothetical protein